MEFLTDSSLPIYLIIFFSPFVQEDAAVLYAASLSANNPALYFPKMFFVILAGLFLSDIWKYWIGWAALRNPKARAFAEKKTRRRSSRKSSKIYDRHIIHSAFCTTGPYSRLCGLRLFQSSILEILFLHWTDGNCVYHHHFCCFKLVRRSLRRAFRMDSSYCRGLSGAYIHRISNFKT